MSPSSLPLVLKRLSQHQVSYQSFNETGHLKQLKKADKRPKRGRDSSASLASAGVQSQTIPATSHSTNASTAISNPSPITLFLPPRSTLSPHVRARIQRQLPLQQGRKVAFRTPPDKATGKSSTPPQGEGNGYEEGAWILAIVKKVEKHAKYVVPLNYQSKICHSSLYYYLGTTNTRFKT